MQCHLLKCQQGSECAELISKGLVTKSEAVHNGTLYFISQMLQLIFTEKSCTCTLTGLT